MFAKLNRNEREKEEERHIRAVSRVESCCFRVYKSRVCYIILVIKHFRDAEANGLFENRLAVTTLCDPHSWICSVTRRKRFEFFFLFLILFLLFFFLFPSFCFLTSSFFPLRLLSHFPFLLSLSCLEKKLITKFWEKIIETICENIPSLKFMNRIIPNVFVLFVSFSFYFVYFFSLYF